MVNKKIYYIITFESTYHSIKAENFLKKADINYRMISIPSVITADCGSGIRIDDLLERVKDIFAENNIENSAIYQVIEENDSKEYTKL